jgi:hypothetical protein
MQGTTALTYVALFGFPVLVYLAFHFMGPQRGTVASLVGGWMFLPSYSKGLGIPLLHSKGMFVPTVVLAASLVLDTRAWRRLRLHLLDLPIIALTAVPFFTSISNNLGAYDGLSASFEIATIWAAPYLLGRLYLGEPRGLRNFAKGLMVGALIYTPLCLWEIRMSPQLHNTLYGFVSSGAFVHNVRFGGYRPTVFMLTGLMVGTFMATGTLVTLWMWRTRTLRSLFGVPLGWVALLLVATTVLVKSVAAVVLMVVGFVTLEVARRFRTPLLVLALMAVPPAFVVARLSGWEAEQVVRLSRESVGGDRAQSVDFRLRNEQLLVEKAKQRPWLGWGRWGRARITDDFGRDVTITDSLWVITLGTFGILALLSQWLAVALPGWALLRRYPARHWGDPRLAAAAVLSVALQLWVIDDLLNAMVTPIFPAIAGALVTFVALGRRARARPPRPAAVPVRDAGNPTPLAGTHGA